MGRISAVVMIWKSLTQHVRQNLPELMRRHCSKSCLKWKKHKSLQNSFRMTNGYKRERHGGRLSQNIIGLRSSSVPRQRVDHVPQPLSPGGHNITVSNEWVLLSQWCRDSHHRASHYTRDRRLPAHLSLSGETFDWCCGKSFRVRSFDLPAGGAKLRKGISGCMVCISMFLLVGDQESNYSYT